MNHEDSFCKEDPCFLRLIFFLFLGCLEFFWLKKRRKKIHIYDFFFSFGYFFVEKDTGQGEVAISLEKENDMIINLFFSLGAFYYYFLRMERVRKNKIVAICKEKYLHHVLYKKKRKKKLLCS